MITEVLNSKKKIQKKMFSINNSISFALLYIGIYALFHYVGKESSESILYLLVILTSVISLSAFVRFKRLMNLKICIDENEINFLKNGVEVKIKKSNIQFITSNRDNGIYNVAYGVSRPYRNKVFMLMDSSNIEWFNNNYKDKLR